MKIILTGYPVPKKSARHGQKRVYNPQKHLMDIHRHEIKRQLDKDFKLLDKQPLYLNAFFFMPIPASYSTKKQDELHHTYHYKKPDSDNLTKYLKDVCTGVIYQDDAIVAAESIQKMYSHNPCTIFYIQPAPSLSIIDKDHFPPSKKRT